MTRPLTKSEDVGATPQSMKASNDGALRAEIKRKYGDDALIFSFDKTDHKIAEALEYRDNGKMWLLPTLEDDCLCKWTRVSEDRACGNHSPVIYRVRKIKELL